MTKKVIDAEETIRNIIIAAPREPDEAIRATASAIVVIENMPSAQPQRKTGKWISEVKGKKAIIDEYGNVTCSAHCSECGDWLTGSDEYACRGRYCPSCGARMDGESE